MMRSLYSGVSGLRNHQVRMDVIGNNIANVNTVGFKKSRTVFQDLYSQTSRGAGAPSATSGGTNPTQVGLGVSLAAIDVMHTPSASQYTGYTMDVMLDGDGYFMVQTPTGEVQYTRAGNFYVDSAYNLVTANGDYVLGLKKDAVAGDDGSYPDTAFEKITIEDPDHKHDTKSKESVITKVRIDNKGVISGINGENKEIVFSTLGVTVFANPQGMEKVGNNLYRATNNSGDPKRFTPDVGEAGGCLPGALEMSNVDLSEEFTDMIVTQRGFQANSRVITVSDTMLEELINLKR